MKRRKPSDKLRGKPRSIVAVSCATKNPTGSPVLKSDGYATLTAINDYIRRNLKVLRRVNYRRGERPRLRDLHLDGRGIVCVLGHYLYVDHEEYWSFFRNEDDRVVAVWQIEG